MRVTKRAIGALVAVIAMVIATIALTFNASAAPYNQTPVIALSTSTPGEGATITVGLNGFIPGSALRITLHTQTYDLGSVTADSAGTFTTSVTLPQGVFGLHTITASGTPSSTNPNTASTSIFIAGGGQGTITSPPPASGVIQTTEGSGGANGGSGGGGGGGGGLASTGVAVVAIGVLGLALLFGGTFMLMAGRRRKAHS